MVTTIDELLQKHAEEDYLRKEIERLIAERKGSPLVEQATEIFNYLPITRNPIEAEYVDHLWDAFATLDTLGTGGRGFLIMPFHLLFIMALQYKILRIAMLKRTVFKSSFLFRRLRKEEKELPEPKSVFTLGFLNESQLPDLLKIIDVNNDLIGQVKALVKNRNENLGHAKGGIERNIESRIGEYLKVLELIQPYFTGINNKVAAKWLSEMEPGEAGIEYIDLHLAEEYLCPADMQQSKLARLEKRLNGE